MLLNRRFFEKLFRNDDHGSFAVLNNCELLFVTRFSRQKVDNGGYSVFMMGLGT